MPLFRYRLAHQDSQRGVAYFTPEPAESMTLKQCLDHVERFPNDEFLRAHVRPLLAAKSQDALLALFESSGPSIQSLIAETAFLAEHLHELWTQLNVRPELDHHSPQIFLACAALPDHARHAQASRLLHDNIFAHASLPNTLRDISLPLPTQAHHTRPAHLRKQLPPRPPCPRRPTPETRATAMDRLFGLGVLEGPEMRHHASLAPWGLLRRWRLDRKVLCGEFAYHLEGTMTSYGRGLNLEDARASLAMEIVERYSSFADIREGRISGSQHDGEIRKSRYSTLGEKALDPNELCLEVPYRDQALHWIRGQTQHGQTLWVPVQSVYLFTNLDEKRLYGGLGSTGLASGNTPEEAKVSGLLEVIERDSETVSLFDPNRCFRARSRDRALTTLFEAHARQGVDVVFQDLTSELGVPCYACFALLPDGSIAKGTGASLSGRHAALSALTEVPFPFPDGPASTPLPQDFPEKILEELPEYSTGSAHGDLDLLERILDDQGYAAVYVDLTKREMRIPVFRAVVPGLEIVADFDRFTRVSPRIWNTAQGLAHNPRTL